MDINNGFCTITDRFTVYKSNMVDSYIVRATHSLVNSLIRVQGTVLFYEINLFIYLLVVNSAH